MAVDPSSGPAYAPPTQYDNVSPEQPLPQDPGFEMPAVEPGEEEAGPLKLTPEAETWIKMNVLDRGYVIDWGTREIVDPHTGEVKGTVPTSFPRMT